METNMKGGKEKLTWKNYGMGTGPLRKSVMRNQAKEWDNYDQVNNMTKLY